MLKKFTFLASAASVSTLMLAACQDQAPEADEAGQQAPDQALAGDRSPADAAPESTAPDGMPEPAAEPRDQAMAEPEPPAEPAPDTDEEYDPAVDYGQPSARADFEFAADAGSGGTAWFFEAPEGVRVYVRVRGMAPGGHAIHVHETGDCSARDFTSAGPHLGADAGEVLDDKPADFEAGVLPDIEVADDGTGMLSATLDTVVFTGAGDTTWPLLDEDRTAVVIHRDATGEGPDDGANPRIACAELYESDM